jgi:hypothetical protein
MNAPPTSAVPDWALPDLFEGLEPEDAAAMLTELLEAFLVDTARRLSNLRQWLPAICSQYAPRRTPSREAPGKWVRKRLLACARRSSSKS